MKDLGTKKKLQLTNGRYFVDIDITTDEWKGMLLSERVFYPEARAMVLAWYYEEGHLAASKTMMNLYCPNLKGTPYNGIVKGLANRILKHLNNRFWVENSGEIGKESFWCIPFEGWHINYDTSKKFVWKLRDELVQAIDETPEFRDDAKNIADKTNDNTLETVEKIKDGKKVVYYTTVYERKSKNRDAAMRIAKQKHGYLRCEACGFNFEKIYGERGKDFIEVHHNKPLFGLADEMEIDPGKDLNCLCSNCHRMIHRNRREILTVTQLKSMIESNK